MKNFRVIAFIICFIVSCKTTSQYSSSERRQMKEAYVYSFKITYFKKMLLSGFRNSNEIKSVLNEDYSSYGEIILTMDDFLFIDSIVAIDQGKLITDSANSIGRRAEGSAGKRVFDFALNRYESKWLNDVAKKRSKSYTHAGIAAIK
ncbi:MAG: hypothetical protein HYI21_14640 [Sediminibacterium sp. Gen4]|jgi:hypothetical protein|uniref:hypothetical protein n=1 Tax=unclassified Sediminibacterium TaxID=2635961 RepID=UPI0015B7E7B1|nr:MULTISPECIES: hypothetical protein [unclassified Sediminibacterium]MBW0156071.1 hypothetical protein [Candidatus Methylopumilus sp.]MBW0164507.1 hypothetical protein [Sediminibacterium sp.]NWK67264.1 hypothetical protein [Sediminibacterium sp. Gen4]